MFEPEFDRQGIVKIALKRLNGQNDPPGAPFPVVVGEINLVTLNQLRLVTGQQPIRFRLILQVRGLIAGISAE